MSEILTTNWVFWILVLFSLNIVWLLIISSSIIIIYPFIARVVGAPQMISQPSVWLLHTLERLCTIWFVCLWCVFKGDNSVVFFFFFFSLVKCLGLSKSKHCGLFRHHKCDKCRCQTLYDGKLSFTCSYSNIDHISVSQRCQNSCKVLLHLCHYPVKLKLVGLLSRWSRQWIYHYFSRLHIFKGDNCHVFWFDKKTLMLAWGTLFKGGISTFSWL